MDEKKILTLDSAHQQWLGYVPRSGYTYCYSGNFYSYNTRIQNNIKFFFFAKRNSLYS